MSAALSAPRKGCWPPEGTEEGTIHWLAQIFHGTIAVERAKWHGSHWTRWLDSRPTGDFAQLCHAVYVGPSGLLDDGPGTVIVPPRSKVWGGEVHQ